ncbi:MAG: hypothetical protein MZV70_72310 [Desulfobacterales bacterium]|nr:hypothetical protein [Desulfobacterales bacterium]
MKTMALGWVTFSPVVPQGVGAVFYIHLCFVFTSDGLVSLQQTDAHGRDLPEPDPQPGQQQPQ